tara:strand:+ start:88 stop:1452 length:1365 start_codon:yes stop_codon:yes gene_type:complete
MKNFKFLLFGIMLSLLLPVGEAGAIFLLISPGAAAQGTGEANVARVDDAYASYYNPAALAFQKERSIAGMHVNWLKSLVPDLYYEYLGFSIPLKGDIGGIGGHLIFLSLGEQTATNEVGDYLGSFSSYMYALDGSYGTKLTDNSALGLGFKIYHQKLADASVAGESGEGKPYSTDFAFDISYLYRKEILNKNKYSFGFNISNIGPPISFVDEDQADPAPTNMRIGFFGNLYEDEFTRLNMMVDMQKLLVAKYPSMDWDGDRLIGGGPGSDNFTNSGGQNEASYSDPWYKAWATAWLDDWYYGGDIDWDGDMKIGGWYWVDGFSDAVTNGQIDEGELIDESNQNAVDQCGSACSGDAIYSNWDGTTAYRELGSGKDRKFSDEFKEVILNTGFEFWYTESFVLRAGYIYDEEGDIKAPTFGAGLRFGGYGFDFGYTAGDKSHPRSNSLFFSISANI